MAEQAAPPDAGGTSSQARSAEPSTGELIAQLPERSSSLVRKQRTLAMAETQQKTKHTGLAAGRFGAAGVMALFGIRALSATAILALTFVIWPGLRPWWFLVAGVVALLGRKPAARNRRSVAHRRRRRRRPTVSILAAWSTFRLIRVQNTRGDATASR